MPDSSSKPETPAPPPSGSAAINARFQRVAGGAVGAGLVLVVLPSFALVACMSWFAARPSIGLPVLAIFGIMMLLGTLALMSTLFARLGLANANEALGLPSGSIRAAIAMSLIVLFALIAVMLYQTQDSSKVIPDVSAADKDAFVKDPLMHVISVTPISCPASTTSSAGTASGASTSETIKPGDNAAPCSGGQPFKFNLRVENPSNAGAGEIAKQLLTLIGTLMTSVVSFYFAAKSSEAAMKTAAAALAQPPASPVPPTPPGPTPPASPPPPAPAPLNVNTPAPSPDDSQTTADDDPGHDHGAVTNPTPDDELPPATGGVAP